MLPVFSSLISSVKHINLCLNFMINVLEKNVLLKSIFHCHERAIKVRPKTYNNVCFDFAISIIDVRLIT
jgi:hypothetical protein